MALPHRGIEITIDVDPETGEIKSSMTGCTDGSCHSWTEVMKKLMTGNVAVEKGSIAVKPKRVQTIVRRG